MGGHLVAHVPLPAILYHCDRDKRPSFVFHSPDSIDHSFNIFTNKMEASTGHFTIGTSSTTAAGTAIESRVDMSLGKSSETC